MPKNKVIYHKDHDDENLINTIHYLVTEEAGSSSEVIFCPDESR